MRMQFALMLLVFGIAHAETRGAPAGQAAVTTPPVPASKVADTAPIESILNEDLIRALRDPFQPPPSLFAKKENPKTDLELYPLKDIKLSGVVSGPKKTRAMVSTPNNKVFFLKVGDSIGIRDGKVIQIMSDAIKVLEYFTNEHGKRVPDIYQISLDGELLSLSKKEGE